MKLPLSIQYPRLGAGLGLRHSFLREIVNRRPKIDWFEVIVEDFFDIGGENLDLLMSIQEHYQLVSHGVCLSIGSTDPLDFDYLNKLKLFNLKIETPWTSDHLCFTRVDHKNLNDLMPLPYTRECVSNVVERIRVVQDFLETPFLIENISRYMTPSDREMSEVEFLSEILEGANCGLLLDLTNVFINSKHHGFEPEAYLSALPLHRVAQVHLAGWEPDSDGRLIDSHDAPVPPEIWNLLKWLTAKIGSSSVMIERDKEIPDLLELESEVCRIHEIMSI